MTLQQVPNVLAQRYASSHMRAIWSPENKVRTERELWVAVLAAQKAAGLKVPDEALGAYREQIGNINLASINARELLTKHDVKARIEEFNSLAGHQFIHLGLTSRDVTENVEQLLITQSLDLVSQRCVTLLARWGEKAMQYAKTPVIARTHNVPAQVTTLGKRFATWAEELLYSYFRLQEVITSYPLRGVTGAVGTAADMQALLDGKPKKLAQFEVAVKEHLQAGNFFASTGQVYPRSLDFNVVSVLTLVAASPSSFATTMRLMTGDEIASEGFAEGQVGSSAMPHKMNARSCERINGLNSVLKGYLAMVTDLVGNQWYEGDVACSVVRRVALPDAFFAIDGLLCTAIRVASDMVVFEEVIDKQLARETPLLASGRIMAAAVKAGVGRETAHQVIGEKARAYIEERRSGEEASFAHALAIDARLGLSEASISEIIAATSTEVGSAPHQVSTVVEAIAALMALNPGAVSFEPEASV